MTVYTTNPMIMSGGADTAASPRLLARALSPLSGGGTLTSLGRVTARTISSLLGGADVTASPKNITHLFSSNLTLSGGGTVTSNARRIAGFGKQVELGGASLVEATFTTRIQTVGGAKYTGLGTVTLKADLWKWKTAKAVPIVSESKLEMYIYDSRDIMENVQRYIPRYYDDSEHAQAIVRPGANESIRLHANMIDVLNQLYIQRATWGLDRWEELFSIKTDYSLSYDNRRTKLLERINGFYAVTTTVLGQEAYNILNGSGVDVTQDTSNLEVIITIKDRQVDSSMDPVIYNKFMDRMRVLIPSHLGIEIKFIWAPWEEVYDADIRFEEVLVYTWNEFVTQYYAKPMFEWEDVARWTEFEQGYVDWDAFTKESWNTIESSSVDGVSTNEWIDYETTWDELNTFGLDTNITDQTWETIEQYTFKQIDSQVTNKWEVAI